MPVALGEVTCRTDGAGIDTLNRFITSVSCEAAATYTWSPRAKAVTPVCPLVPPMPSPEPAASREPPSCTRISCTAFSSAPVGATTAYVSPSMTNVSAPPAPISFKVLLSSMKPDPLKVPFSCTRISWTALQVCDADSTYVSPLRSAKGASAWVSNTLTSPRSPFRTAPSLVREPLPCTPSSCT